MVGARCTPEFFFPQRLRYGYPFLPSLNDKACNVGIKFFQPPLSTGPTIIIVIIIIVVIIIIINLRELV